MNKNDIVKIIHQPDVEQRVVIYWAIAYSVNYKYLTKQTKPTGDIKVDIKKIVEHINELGIIDNTKLEKCILNLYLFLTQNKNGEDIKGNIYSAQSFEEMILLYQYISKSEIDDINKHFTLFKKGVSIVNEYTNVLSDILGD